MIFWPRHITARGAAMVISVIILMGSHPQAAMAADEAATRIEVELTESFYRALKAEGTKTYSTDKSEAYLRQIAVSSRFAVESNLHIIKQQARIIELLEAIKDQKR